TGVASSGGGPRPGSVEPGTRRARRRPRPPFPAGRRARAGHLLSGALRRDRDPTLRDGRGPGRAGPGRDRRGATAVVVAGPSTPGRGAPPRLRAGRRRPAPPVP